MLDKLLKWMYNYSMKEYKIRFVKNKKGEKFTVINSSYFHLKPKRLEVGDKIDLDTNPILAFRSNQHFSATSKYEVVKIMKRFGLDEDQIDIKIL